MTCWSSIFLLNFDLCLRFDRRLGECSLECLGLLVPEEIVGNGNGNSGRFSLEGHVSWEVELRVGVLVFWCFASPTLPPWSRIRVIKPLTQRPRRLLQMPRPDQLPVEKLSMFARIKHQHFQSNQSEVTSTLTTHFHRAFPHDQNTHVSQSLGRDSYPRGLAGSGWSGTLSGVVQHSSRGGMVVRLYNPPHALMGDK